MRDIIHNNHTHCVFYITLVSPYLYQTLQLVNSKLYPIGCILCTYPQIRTPDDTFYGYTHKIFFLWWIWGGYQPQLPYRSLSLINV